MGAAAIFGRLTGRSLFARLFFGSLLLLMIVVTRWCWIDCDGGTPSLVEYGYFATDEGYYCGGGRQKFLRDRFISAKRATPCTYAICPSTHVMTWWAFNLFGQTTWAHRVFPFLMCTGAWLAAFHFFSRKTLPWLAFLLCAACVLNPFLMVYGRTACNDTLMGALLLIGYVVTRRRARLAPLAGGLIFGLGLWVKVSIWALVPVGLSAAAMSADPRGRLRRMAVFVAGFAVSACVQYGLIRLMIVQDAVEQNTTVDELLRISNSSYPLPNLLDWRLVLRALSSFPRSPADGLLSVWIALFLVLPALLLLRRLTERPFRWDGRLLLYFSLPLYAAGIIVLPVFYAHYYIPVIMLAPVVWREARHELKKWAGGAPWLSAALMALAMAFVLVSYHSFVVYPDEAQGLTPFLSNAYNLPAQIVWLRNGLYILAAAALLLTLGLTARMRRLTFLTLLGVSLSALGVADLCYSSIPLCEAFKHTMLFSASMKTVAGVLQVSCLFLFFAVWGLPKLLSRGVRWYLLLPALLAAATAVNPVWRSGSVELTQRSQLHKQAVAELARLVPDNAVVFGERAPQLFLSLKPRVSSAPNRDPVPIVMRVHAAFPEWPLFALLDSEHNYHFTHYEENKDKIRMEVLRTLKLPSFNTSLPSDVFLVRLHILDSPSRPGPLSK